MLETTVYTGCAIFLRPHHLGPEPENCQLIYRGYAQMTLAARLRGWITHTGTYDAMPLPFGSRGFNAGGHAVGNLVPAPVLALKLCFRQLPQMISVFL